MARDSADSQVSGGFGYGDSVALTKKNEALLRSMGYGGNLYQGGGSGDGDGAETLSQDFQDWAGSQGLAATREGPTSDNGHANIWRLNQQGNNVGSAHGYVDNDSMVRMLSPVAMFATGGLAAGFGGGAMGGAMAGAATGGTMGGIGAFEKGGNILEGIGKGALIGGAAGGLSGFNTAGSLGIENKLGQSLINGGIKGGVSSALKGGDIGQGLLGGALNGGISGAWNAVGGLNGIGSAIGGAFGGDTAALAGDQVSALGGGGMDFGGMDFGGMFDGGGGGYDWGNVDMFPDGGAGFDFGGTDMFGNFAQVPELDYSQLLGGGGYDWGNTNMDGSTSMFGSGGLGGAIGGLANKVLGGLGSAAGSAAGAVGGGGNLAALIGAGLGATQGGQQQTRSTQDHLDPRMQAMLYGTGPNDPKSLFGAAQNQFQASPDGMNPTMRAGLEMQRASLTDPAYGDSYRNMRTQGNGLMNMQAATNPFAQQGGPTMQAGGVGGLLGESGPDRIQALMMKGRGLLG